MKLSQQATTLLSLVFAGNQQRAVGEENPYEVNFDSSECVDFVDDGTWTALPLNDDNSTYVDLPFEFDFYGGRTYMYINTNGNLSFKGPYPAHNPQGFPSNKYQMIAPFWGDVDTTVGGNIWYKAIGSEKFVVTWTGVARYGNETDLVNDFQVIISTGCDTDMGLGNNVCFCYGDMQWTTGDASGGIDGFYGRYPATVGVNAGTFAPKGTYFLIGQFDKPGDSYDGPNGLPDGIDYLDHQSFCFNLVDTTTSPPTFAPTPPPTVSPVSPIAPQDMPPTPAPTGNEPVCLICGNDEYPGKPLVWIGNRYLGMYTCGTWYERGLNKLIPGFLCGHLQEWVYEKCGCGEHNPNPPTLPPVNSSCENEAGWKDDSGTSCEWYENNEPAGCPNWSWYPGNGGLTAGDACCHCQA